MSRRVSLSLFVLLILSINGYAQGRIEIVTDNSWGRGNYNKIELIIDIPDMAGLARYAQELPPGYEVIAGEVHGGDLYQANNTLYIVWLKALPVKGKSVSFWVKPPAGSRDDLVIGGTLAYIGTSGGRHIVKAAGKYLTILTGRGLSYQQLMAIKESQQPEENPLSGKSAAPVVPVKTSDPVRSGPGTASSPSGKITTVERGNIIFRVQVLTSSSRLSIGQLRQRTGIDLPEELKIVQAGNLYKHQVGACKDYESAVILKNRVVSGGLKEAFIVAWDGERSLPVDEALKLTGKR